MSDYFQIPNCGKSKLISKEKAVLPNQNQIFILQKVGQSGLSDNKVLIPLVPKPIALPALPAQTWQGSSPNYPKPTPNFSYLPTYPSIPSIPSLQNGLSIPLTNISKLPQYPTFQTLPNLQPTCQSVDHLNLKNRIKQTGSMCLHNAINPMQFRMNCNEMSLEEKTVNGKGRCHWSKEEDEALKEVMGNKPSKWNNIAKMIVQKLGVCGKTGKQCRERYHNYLNPKINRRKWTNEEQSLFFKIHRKVGGKWCKISAALNNRTDNAVKNYFYCRLRKIARMCQKQSILKINQLNDEEGENFLYLVDYLYSKYVLPISHCGQCKEETGIGDKYLLRYISVNKITPQKMQRFRDLLVDKFNVTEKKNTEELKLKEPRNGNSTRGSFSEPMSPCSSHSRKKSTEEQKEKRPQTGEFPESFQSQSETQPNSNKSFWGKKNKQELIVLPLPLSVSRSSNSNLSIQEMNSDKLEKDYFSFLSQITHF
jgi:hypothetical protein